MKVKGYKNFNKDMICNAFKYKEGKSYTHDGEIALCSEGFHFHRNPFDLFSYYTFDLEKTKVAEIEASGEIIDGDNKSVCSKIKIVKILNEEEIRKLGNLYKNTGWGNSGDRNSGDRNSGDRNSGDRNSGYRNSGDRNSGDSNSGSWNKANYSAGHFNSITEETIMVFNQPCKREEWEKTRKPNFIYFSPTEWIYSHDMTEEEKQNFPKHETTGGYLKVYTYREAWKKAFASASESDIDLLKALPNFNNDVFEEITGIKVK